MVLFPQEPDEAYEIKRIIYFLLIEHESPVKEFILNNPGIISRTYNQGDMTSGIFLLNCPED